MSVDKKDNSVNNRVRGLIPFKKGESGNPAGRPVGAKHKSTLYREAFISIANSKGLTPEELEDKLEEVGIDKALEGNFNFYNELRERQYGKVVQRNENVNVNANLDKLQEKDKDKISDLLNG